jgi:hypothetical protein
VRLKVGWPALPPDGGEEEADACLTFRAVVMNDVTEGQVSRVDQDACFLTRFADRSLDHRFTGLQVPAGRAQLTVGVAGARPLQQEDHSVGRRKRT